MDAIDTKASIDKEVATVCSICLEIVDRCLARSTTRLRCGHEFHLDCIGSAFNAKGAMQCPNCRKIEKGNWLFGNGSRSLQDLNFDEWNHDEDLNELNNSEVVYGFHWCPFSRLARLLPLIEDREFTTAMPFQELIGPYLAYIQPPLPPYPRELSGEPWNQVGSMIREGQTPHNWDHYHPPYSLPNTRSNGSHPDAFSSTSIQPSRVHPFFGHGSSARPTGSFIPSPIPPFISNPRPHGHAHRVRNSNIVGPAPPSLLDQTNYYLFPPTRSSNRPHQQSLEGSRDIAPFPLMTMPTDRDSGYWRQIFPRSNSSFYRPPHRR